MCVGSVSSAAVLPVAAECKSWYLRMKILRFSLGFCFIYANLKAECALDFSSVKHLLSSLRAISQSMSIGKLLIICFTWALAHAISSTHTSLQLNLHRDSIWYNQSSNVSNVSWVLQQTYDHTSSESLPEPCLAWLLLGILVFRWLCETVLLTFGLFYVGHSTPQRWFNRIGQKSFPALLCLSWACELLKSLLTLLLKRDFAHLYHLFPLVQVDLLDLLVQEVLGVHTHI